MTPLRGPLDGFVSEKSRVLFWVSRNAIVVADSRAIEQYVGVLSSRRMGVRDGGPPIVDERAGY